MLTTTDVRAGRSQWYRQNSIVTAAFQAVVVITTVGTARIPARFVLE